MHDGGDPLEAHPGIDVLGGEGGEISFAVRVELDEDEVPDLDAKMGVGVDELAFALAVWGEVEVELAAGAAGARFAHHPKIVLLVSHDDVDGGIKPGFLEDSRPNGMRFLVEFGRVAFSGFVYGRVEAFGREFPNIHKQFPAPFDGFFFEVVSERPVAEHLEEGVVVGVETDVLQVVVLASGSDAFLGVCGPGVWGFLVPEKIRDELVHPGVGEEKIGRFREKRSRGYDLVFFRFEEIEKGLTDFPGFHEKIFLRSDVRGWLDPFLRFPRILLPEQGRRYESRPGWFP